MWVGFQTYIINKDLRFALDLASKKQAFRLTDEARKLLEENLKLGNEKVDAISVIKVSERGIGHEIQWEIEITWKETLIIPLFDVLQYD